MYNIIKLKLKIILYKIYTPTIVKIEITKIIPIIPPYNKV